MKWFYMEDGQETGPFSKDTMQQLVNEGKITRESYVRNETNPNWTTYGNLLLNAQKKRMASGQGNAPSRQDAAQAASPAGTTGGQPQAGQGACTECGGAFADDDLISYQDARVCASCKPMFFQKLREGVAQTTFMQYAGFWVRFGAKIIDNIILSIVNAIIGAVGGMLMAIPAGADTGQSPETLAIGALAIMTLLQIAIAAGYSSYFLGKFAATPGKMALGLKVVRPDNSPVSYARGFGRYFAEILSGAILAIGYLMAAFDEEKRALHDHICNTRVIRK